jgi:U3 small nucleolar RNA-associated protein 18
MSRQRSKKLSNSRKAEEQSIPELQRHESEEQSHNESLEMLEKDSDEEELDRLVLGDDAGFMAQLGGDMDIDEEESEEGEGAAGESDAGEGLEGIDDADVKPPLSSC